MYKTNEMGSIENNNVISSVNLHVCPVCGWAHLITYKDEEASCGCGYADRILSICHPEEKLYEYSDEINFEGAFETAQKSEFQLEYLTA